MANNGCPKGQYWNGKKCVKQLDEGAFNDIGTRIKASIIKFGESSFGLTPGDRTVYEQAALNKDKALHLSNAAKAKEEAKKQAAYKAKVKKMQIGPNGYQKVGGSVKPKMAMGGTKKTVKKPVKKYLTGGPTGAGDGTSRKPNTTPEDPKGYVKAKPKTAKYGTAMMKKGGMKKSC